MTHRIHSSQVAVVAVGDRRHSNQTKLNA